MRISIDPNRVWCFLDKSFARAKSQDFLVSWWSVCSCRKKNFHLNECDLEDLVLETIQVNTPDRSAMLDVTDSIARKVQESGIRSGLCVIYVPHTTAGVTINEGADPAVVEDILTTLEQLIPWQGQYRHVEGNSAAHVKAALMGTAVQVIVDSGRLALGTWQRIFLCEFDGPRTRKLRIKLIQG
jgi:secondary thiamine-phosphate synthase enzyme